MKALCSLPIRVVLIAALLAVSTAWAEPRFQVEERRESFTSGGRKIGVETFAPAGPRRFPAVLVLHSSAGTLFGHAEMRSFARALAARGKVAFLVRYFDRTRTIFANDREIDRFTGVWLATVNDAVDFAARHPRVRAAAIGTFGFSLGAFLAVAQGSLDRRIDAVVEVAGGVLDGLEPRMRRMPPVLILHGDADQRVPLAEAYQVQRAARRFATASEMKIYPREGHRLSAAAAADATTRALRFFDRHLP
jgi:dienelactone hydrolase